jgi:hypothetical protein
MDEKAGEETMSDELKDFRYYADKAEASIKEARDYTSPERPGSHDTVNYMLKTASVYAELAKAAPKAEPAAPVRCPEWLSREIRDLPKGFIDYQCVLFAGHGAEHESSIGQYWLTEVTK